MRTPVDVLIVDDEPAVGPLLRDQLRQQGVAAALVTTVAEATDQLAQRSFGVVVVDLAVDGGAGLEVVTELRRAGRGAHVVALGADPGIRAEALAAGADDLVPKPFLAREVTARVMSVRAREDAERDAVLAADALTIDLQARQVHVDGRLIDLTAREFDLLAYLAARPGHVFSRDQLLRAVWRSEPGWQQPATVTEHIRRLRAKVEADPQRPVLLRTVRGVGYRFDRPGAAAPPAPPSTAPATFVHRDGRITEADPALGEMLGCDAADLVGRDLVDIVAAGSKKAALARQDAAARGTSPLTQLMELVRADGSEVAVEVSSTAIQGEGGPARRVVLTPIQDPSVRLRRLMTGVLSELADAVIITDLHFHVRSWNKAAERLYGWTEAEVVGRHMLDILGWDGDNGELDTAWRALELRDRWNGAGVQSTRDGSVMSVLATTTLVRDGAGEAIGYVSVNRPAVPPPAAAGDGPGDDQIRAGLAAGEFEVHYQPVVTLDEERHVVTLEALVRWNHPERGLLAPAAFIDSAEAGGSIVDLGAFVLATASRQVAAWRRAGAAVDLAVNLSARELSEPGLVDRVAATLAATGLAAGDLWLEVTETALVVDVETASAILERLVALGVHIAIDDFGTGWASLTYLRAFPVEALKIDRSFIAEVGRNPSDTAIVRSILSLGGELGLFVVAEGIETEAQQDALVELGCTIGQGYLYGRPTPADGVPLARLRRFDEGVPVPA